MSYRWGQQERRRFTEGPLNDILSPLIEDVIGVTLKLGYRYLWVDYYCIDQEDAEEKAVQIAQMDVIYGTSETTKCRMGNEDSRAELASWILMLLITGGNLLVQCG